MNIAPNLKLAMFRSMLRIRLVEEAIIKYYPEQEMRCPCHLSIGQEAIPVGVCALLDRTDYAFGTYRSHGLYLAKGGNLNAMIAELYGKQTGVTAGRGGSMQLIAPEVGILCISAIVGGTIPMAVGAALAAKLARTKTVSVVFFGDGATEEGVFHESLNFSALKKLPVLFVCENNLYSVYSHLTARQFADNICERVAAYHMPNVCIDGNDVTAVYQAAKDALEHIKQGKGPAFIEFRTYRQREHVGINFDWHLGYRSEEEVKEWIKRCPVQCFKEQLISEKVLSEDVFQVMKKEISEEIEGAFNFAKESQYPSPESMYEWVYAGD